MKLIYTLLVVFAFTYLNGQNTFIQTTNMVGIHDEASSLVSFDDGSIFTVTNHAGCPYPGSYLIKYDSDGNRNWSKAIRYNSDSIWVSKIISHGDNFICGYGMNFQGLSVLFKMDTSGNVQWCRENTADDVKLTDIISLPDSSIISCGYFIDSLGTHSYVGRFSNSGWPIQESSLLGASTPKGIACLSDSSIVVATEWHHTIQRHVIELIRLDKNMQFIKKVEIDLDTLVFPWVAGLSSTGKNLVLTFGARTAATAIWYNYTMLLDSSLSSINTRRLSFRVSGMSDFNHHGKAIIYDYISPQMDCIVVDTLGNILSGKRYYNSSQVIVPFCVATFRDDGFLIGGYYEFPTMWDKSSFTIKTDSTGKTSCNDGPINYQSFSDSLSSMSSNDTVIQAYIFSNVGTLSLFDFYQPQKTICATVGTTEFSEIHTPAIELSPNPNDGQFMIISTHAIENIFVLSITGEALFEQQGSNTDHQNLDMAGFPVGSYLIGVQTFVGIEHKTVVIAR